jgi:hypothetical protein
MMGKKSQIAHHTITLYKALQLGHKWQMADFALPTPTMEYGDFSKKEFHTF